MEKINSQNDKLMTKANVYNGVGENLNFSLTEKWLFLQRKIGK